MEEKPKILVPDEILVGLESDTLNEEKNTARSHSQTNRDVFSLIKDTRMFNFLAALGYFVLFAVCLIIGSVVFILSLLGRFLGDPDQKISSHFFRLVVLLFLRTLGFLFGTFYPPWGRMFLRFFGQ